MKLQHYKIKLEVPFSPELMQEYSEYIDWSVVPFSLFQQIDVQLLRDHVPHSRLQKKMNSHGHSMSLENLRLMLNITQGNIDFDEMLKNAITDDHIVNMAYLLNKGYIEVNHYLEKHRHDLLSLSIFTNSSQAFTYLIKKGASPNEDLLRQINNNNRYHLFYRLHQEGIDLSHVIINMYHLKEKIKHLRRDRMHKSTLRDMEKFKVDIEYGKIKMKIIP